MDEDTAEVRLKCVWEYDGNSSFVEFDVRWIGDEFNRNRQINKTFNGNDEREYLYEYQFAFGLYDNRNYEFNKEVCMNLNNNLRLLFNKILQIDKFMIIMNTYSEVEKMKRN